MTENRASDATSRVSLTFEATFSGALPGGVTVESITLLRAVDNTGAVLPVVATTQGRAGLARAGRGTGSARLPGVVSGVKRTATALKSIDGTVNVRMPNDIGGGTIRVTDVHALSGAYSHPRLAELGIVFHVYADQASRSEAPRLLNNPGPPLTSELAKTWTTTMTERGGTAFRIIDGILPVLYKGPLGALRTFELQDAKGIRLPPGLPLPPDAVLAIYLATDRENLLSVPFRIEDVPLP